MGDRKYLEDVPKKIQDWFFDKDTSPEDLLRTIRESYDISTDESLAKCTEIRKRVWELNPELAPRFDQKKDACFLSLL